MSPRQPLARLLIASACACAMASVVGCAGLRLPRIDPSGERLLIFPKDEPRQVEAVAPAGNTLAAPVLTDPVFPQQPLQTTTPQAAIQPIDPLPVTAGKPAQDYLRISPDRYLAPIGAEVILKAGLCCTDGFLLKEQRVDWLLADGTGEFVELGGRGYLQPALLPFNKPSKIDNRYARGYTSSVRRVIDRGTADQRDDVLVLPGEAWASVTSPREGISHITAVTPEIKTWNTRRARATVYWVDAQWTFPQASLVAASADSQTLTTNVRRQSDGLPVEGWVVRYEVIGGDASLAGSANQVVETKTDSNGNASIQVTPSAGSGGVTRIDAQLLRPAGLGGPDWPRLVVSQSSTTVSWPGGGTPYAPGVTDFGNPSGPTLAPTPAQPAPTLPPATPPGTFPSQPPPQQTNRRPQLDLQIFGDAEAQVGRTTRFEIVIRNTGDAPATGILLNDRFDGGLSHLRDPDRNLQIENRLQGSLEAGQTRSVILNFDVLREGTLCHDVTVTAAEGARAVKRACVNAAQPLPRQQPSVEITKQGPRLSNVGESALFAIVVRNTGETPLTGLQVIDEYDRNLRATPSTPGSRVVNNRLVWQVDRLEVGESRRFEVRAECLSPSSRACSKARVTGAAGIDRLAEACIEIRARLGNGGAPSGGAGPGLRLTINKFSDTVRQGTRAVYEVRLTNGPNASDENVQVRVIFSPQLVPDVNSIRADVGNTLVGNEVRFNAIAQMRPNDMLLFTIPIDALQVGLASVTAQAVSRRAPQGVTATTQVEVISR